MGKMKVHELAKELDIPSKDLVDKIKELGYDIKSHMSTLEDADVKKIKSKLSGNSSKASSSKTKAASKTEVNKEEKKVAPEKRERKQFTPVIIRREVTRITTDDYKEKDRNEERSRTDLGVVQRRTDTSMNIKYRTEPRRPAPIVTGRKEPAKPIARTITKKEPVSTTTTPQEVVNTQEVEKQNTVKVAPTQKVQPIWICFLLRRNNPFPHSPYYTICMLR